MADYLALGSALYTALDTASTVNVYYALAPQGSATPYCIFQRQTGVHEYTFGTSETVSTDYVVKVVSNRTWAGEAQTIYDGIHTTFNDSVLTVTGYQALRCRRNATIEYRDPDGFWHVGGIYRVDVAL